MLETGTRFLPVGSGNSLDLVLLLDGVRVGGLLGAVHDLISETLRDGLDVTERRGASTLGDEGDSLVDSSEGGNVDSLTTNDTSGADTSGVLTRATVLDGIDENLNRVLVGQKMDDLEGMLHDADRELLLTVVAALHHHGVDEALDDGASGLAEALLLVATSGVGKEDTSGALEGDVVHQRQVRNVHVLVRPLAEESGSHSRHAEL
jgi:hypothetical protein